MHLLAWLPTALLIVDWVVRLGLSFRVIMRHKKPSTSLAWLVIILSLPIAGAALYLLIGEQRLGAKRAAREAALAGLRNQRLQTLADAGRVAWDDHPHESPLIARLALHATGYPAQPGNAIDLFPGSDAFFDRLLADLDAAQHTIHLAFYIVQPGGRVDDVFDALRRAADRGVTVRLAADSLGSKPFHRGSSPRDLRAAGIEVVESLQARAWRALLVRMDIRNHRKIVVIDGHTAYTGSQNLVDPATFKQDADVGQWVDAMVRVQGPAVAAMQLVFLQDWQLETNQGLDRLVGTDPDAAVASPLPVSAGDVDIQVLPSGPVVAPEAIHEVMLAALYAADERIVITTPYFSPDEAMMAALCSAAKRGLDVTLIVPEKVDSLLVKLASRAFFGDLLAAGVRIHAYTAGLLHTKTITIDNSFCFVGSVNLDMRSFFLNFELTLAVYDHPFTQRIVALQDDYLTSCTEQCYAQWQSTTLPQRLTENTARLLSPLL